MAVTATSWVALLRAINLGSRRRVAMADLRALSSDRDGAAQTAEGRRAFAQTLLELTRTLDSHVERYDGEVLPSILRALFHK